MPTRKINGQASSTKIENYLFSYRYRAVLQRLDPLPDWSQFILKRLNQSGIPLTANHLLINEYETGQGIMPHVDSPKLFGPIITSLTLGSPCVMTFAKDSDQFNLVLPSRSMLVMRDQVRYEYTHQISKLAQEKGMDLMGNCITVVRDRRVSMTFREMVPEALLDLPGES